MELGGRADKLGNDYERAWVVRQLLLVLQGEAESVLWEGLGDDERGVDVWVSYSDGTRVGYQCKRQNGSVGKWQISDLREVLENAKFQLKRSPTHRFIFVSADPAAELRELADRSRRADGNAKVYTEHLAVTSRVIQNAFGKVCEYWGLDSSEAKNQSEVFELLCRIEVQAFDCGRAGREELRSLARATVEGEAKSVINELEKFAQEKLGNRVHADQVRDYLRKRNFQPRRLSDDAEVQAGIERLQERFERSLGHLLIGGKVIERHETAELLEKIMEGGEARILCVHGQAGCGKSGILYELTKRLEEDEVPFLPVRLDRYYPAKNSDWFGKEGCGLPSSLVACLKAVAGKRRGVLILDQLDAIRWTSAHSAEAWDVVEEIVEEALAHSNLCVLVACRSFDLNDDPRIKAWKSRQKNGFAVIKVGELQEEKVAEVVKDQGGNWGAFSARQKRLLRSPENLYLWTQLESANQTFRTATDLMKKYWEDLWKKKVPALNVSIQECRGVLDELVKYMDKSGRLKAPDNLVPHLTNAQDALISLNVLGRSDDGVVFSHQSHLDYLVAERVLSEIRSGEGGLVGWLKRTNQSLFRREQLRHVLTLLRDEDEKVYCNTLEVILKTADIRFHLKHLVLTFLGNIDAPLVKEVELVLRLLEVNEWSEQVTNIVLWNRTQWFKVLYDNGTIEKWLNSEEDRNIELAMRMMTVLLPECSEEVYRSIRPFEGAGNEWTERIKNTLALRYDVYKECAELFAMRIRLIRRGVFMPQFLHWEQLAKKTPRRCLLLFRVCVSRLVDLYLQLPKDSSRGELPSLSCLGWQDVEFVAVAAERKPKYACWTLMQWILRRNETIKELMERYHPYEDVERDEELLAMRDNLELPLVLPAIEKVLTTGGSIFARDWAREFFKAMSDTYGRLPRRAKKAMIRGLSEGPDELADNAIVWLSEHPDAFKLERGYYVGCWEPAERLIRRFSSVCSDNVLKRLEETILEHREAEIKRDYERKIDLFRTYNVIICNEYGRTQHVLLRCVPKELLSEKARTLLRQLDRKFAANALHKAQEFHGGCVGSPIPSEKLGFVSDKEWLRIIDADWSQKSRRWKQMGPDRVGEANHEHFADDFGCIAEQQPQRFAKLGLHITKDAYSGYMSRILRAVALKEPPDSVKDEEREKWEPATGTQVEAVLEYVDYSEERNQAVSFCELIEKRCDADWPEDILKRLVRYATEHPDPGPEEFTVKRIGANGEHVPDVINSAINCVRGRAAGAIARLLFDQPGLIAKFEPAIEKLVNDSSPAVRVAAMRVCLPILNIDRDKAVALFVKACDMEDDRILDGPYADRFITYAWHTHIEVIKPIIERMARSENQKVATAGAGWATGIWLRKGEMEALKKKCCVGSDEQRKGAAKVAARWLRDGSDLAKHVELLKRFFVDEETEVRREGACVFRREERLHIPEVVSLSEYYVETPSFDDGPNMLFYGLEDYTGNLALYAETLLKAGHKLAEELAPAARNIATRIAGATRIFAKLMLRLYEQTYNSREKELNLRCLGIWDRMLEAGIVETRTLEEIGA